MIHSKKVCGRQTCLYFYWYCSVYGVGLWWVLTETRDYVSSGQAHHVAVALSDITELWPGYFN